MKSTKSKTSTFSSSSSSTRHHHTTEQYQIEIENLIITLSQKENEQSTKREKCSEIVDQIKYHQTQIDQLRKEVNETMDELHTLDDEINVLQKKRDRMILSMNLSTNTNNSKNSKNNTSNNSHSHSGGKIRNKDNVDNDCHDDGDYNDFIMMQTQYPQNMTQDIGEIIGATNTYDNNVSHREQQQNRQPQQQQQQPNNNNHYHREEKKNDETALSSVNNNNNNRRDDEESSNNKSSSMFYNKNTYNDTNDDIEEFYDNDDNEEPPSYLFENNNNKNNNDDDINRSKQDEEGEEYEFDDIDTRNAHNNSFDNNRNHHNHYDNTISGQQQQQQQQQQQLYNNNNNGASHQTIRGSTIDHYFNRPTASNSTTQNNTSIFPASIQQQLNITSSSSNITTSTSFHNNINNHNQQLRPTAEQRNQEYLQKLSSDTYPWSNFVYDLLRNTFKIRNFRDHQKQIINCTLSGDDAFVIMRTGGGKSLTYQLPALLEGRSQSRKITLVVSPLLSLIRDQEEQMNEFASGSAVAFTSGIGQSEQTRRWQLVRDRNSGVCIIFVTPERVFKSNKLRSELEKLNDQNRLGRFVIDECHCACQWGHDFRPDYTKLGILKQHFPNVPLIAVTATASNRVREDCCRILRLGTNYQFFRSSANRPNLHYSVKIKPEGQDKVIEEMSKFIKENHKNHAGIIYTFSKKDANTVADKLNKKYGITAKAYHSDVSDTAKESIHRSWMRNRTQVVVATIAFGLGINKPDVRFVLHHSLSKSLEAYYQESGRAGRDGCPADCVLYYSVKDISRMVGMIHGEVSEPSFWSMVRYAQEHGNDSMCRRIILSVLGEPGCENINDILTDETSSLTITREVGQYAKDVVRLIQESSKDLTIQQVVALWRGKGKETPDFIKDNSPGSHLNRDECERLIVALMLTDVLHPKVVFTSYTSIVYVGLKNNAAKLLSSNNPKVKVKFPLRSHNDLSVSRSTTNTKVSQSTTISNSDGWLSTKTNRSSSANKNPPKANKSKQTKKSTTKETKKKKSNVVDRSSQHEVIDILDDSDDELPRKRPSRLSAINASKKMRSETNSDFLYDSEASSSENEF